MPRMLVEFGFLLLVVLLATGGYYRARIVAFVSPPPSAAHPSERPDVLYTWVDAEGVTHFSAEEGQGRRVEYNGSAITPIAPVEPRLLARLDELEEERKPKGSMLIHQIRQEAEENRAKIQMAQEAAAGL